MASQNTDREDRGSKTKKHKKEKKKRRENNSDNNDVKKKKQIQLDNNHESNEKATTSKHHVNLDNLNKKIKKRRKTKTKKNRLKEGEEVKDERSPMELLELEMRARAIKSLLVRTDQDEAKAVAAREASEKESEIEMAKEKLNKEFLALHSKGSVRHSEILKHKKTKKNDCDIIENTENIDSQSDRTESNKLKELEMREKAINSLMKKKNQKPVKVDDDTGEAVPQRDWTKLYDKPMPESILMQCLGGECRLCSLQIHSMSECQQHYGSERHCRRVADRLDTLFSDRPGEPLGWRQSLAPKLLPEKEKKKEVAQLSCKSKREEERGEHHKEWQEQYDKPMPESVLKLCLYTECKLCGVQLKSDMMCKQHYEGKLHFKKVNLELEELFQLSGDLKPKRVLGTLGKKKKQKPHYMAPTLTSEVLEAAQNPPTIDPARQFDLDEMDEVLVCGRNIGKRPKYWA